MHLQIVKNGDIHHNFLAFLNANYLCFFPLFLSAHSFLALHLFVVVAFSMSMPYSCKIGMSYLISIFSNFISGHGFCYNESELFVSTGVSAFKFSSFSCHYQSF